MLLTEPDLFTQSAHAFAMRDPKSTHQVVIDFQLSAEVLLSVDSGYFFGRKPAEQARLMLISCLYQLFIEWDQCSFWNTW